jgi:hypothetical protein
MSVIVELGVPEVPFFGRLVNPIISKRGQIVPTTLFFDIFAPLVDRASEAAKLVWNFWNRYGMHPQILPVKEAKPGFANDFVFTNFCCQW